MNVSLNEISVVDGSILEIKCVSYIMFPRWIIANVANLAVALSEFFIAFRWSFHFQTSGNLRSFSIIFVVVSSTVEECLRFWAIEGLGFVVSFFMLSVRLASGAFGFCELEILFNSKALFLAFRSVFSLSSSSFSELATNSAIFIFLVPFR